MPPDRPDIFQYLDHRAFLADWFSWRQACSKRFSHRMFARLAGQKNPSLLLLVIKGQRNLTARTAEAFCRAMSLEADEAAFFALLVRLDGAVDPDLKQRTWEQIAASRRFRAARRIDGEAVRYLSHWYCPVIRELANCPGFRADPAWIARTLRPRITVAQASSALATLIELDMLRPQADGGLRPVETTVVTPHEVAAMAARSFHLGMLDRARECVDSVDQSERHLGAVTVSVPEAMIGLLKQEIAAFQERLLELCDGAEEAPDRVYQVNLQLFPLSRTTGVEAP